MKKFGERNGQCNMNYKNITCEDINRAFQKMQIDDIKEEYGPYEIKYNFMDNKINFWFNNEAKFNRFQSTLLKNSISHVIYYTFGYTIVGLHMTALDSVSKIKYDIIRTRLYEYMKKQER